MQFHTMRVICITDYHTLLLLLLRLRANVYACSTFDRRSTGDYHKYRTLAMKTASTKDYSLNHHLAMLAKGVKIVKDEFKDHPDIIDKVTGKITSPKNLFAAFNRPDAKLWEAAWQKEADALDSKGVISHNHTLDELRAMGITAPPIPMGVLLDVKYDQDGEVEKYKARNVLKGHKGNVYKGVHYTETFSAAPDLNSTRFLQVIGLMEGMERLCWDVTQKRYL